MRCKSPGNSFPKSAMVRVCSFQIVIIYLRRADDRMDMQPNDDKGVHDTKGKAKAVDKGDIESGNEDQDEGDDDNDDESDDNDIDENEDEGEDNDNDDEGEDDNKGKEAEIQPDIVTVSRPKNARVSKCLLIVNNPY